MREIKFRAWDEDTETMADWSVLTSLIEGRRVSALSKVEFERYKSSTDLIRGVIYEGNPFTISSFKLMQYTGLLDKNGREIYEGDILGFDWFEERDRYCYIAPVVFERGCFEVFIENISANHNLQLGHLTLLEDAVVIGNIHENPELLKPKERA